MDHVAGPELAGVEQAGAVLAPAAQAAGAPAEELPPLVLTPALEAAVRAVVTAARKRDAAALAWQRAVEYPVAGRNTAGLYMGWRKAEAALATAATTLAREVSGGAADRPDQ